MTFSFGRHFRVCFSVLERGVSSSCASLKPTVGTNFGIVKGSSVHHHQPFRIPTTMSTTYNQMRQFQRKVADKPQRAYQVDSDSDSDSESDSEMHHEKGNSEFWRRKMRTFHGLIDINKDGVVSIDDFTILAQRFINLGHLTSQQQQEFTEMLKVVWEEQWGIVHPYNTVTAEQYLDNMHHVLNDKSLKRKAHNFLPHLFKAVDKDKNGTISVEEFKLFFECLGLNEEDAAASFSSIDINKDGYLNQKEFVKLGREFFISEDEATASRNFFGPLIKP